MDSTLEHLVLASLLMRRLDDVDASPKRPLRQVKRLVSIWAKITGGQNKIGQMSSKIALGPTKIGQFAPRYVFVSKTKSLWPGKEE
jgi:hypothetical protein